MNTRFSYLYRDAGNYKTHHDVVLTGHLEEAAVRRLLFEGELFIPHELGLPELQRAPFTADDHIWHELETIAPTADVPTDPRSAAELLASMEQASSAGWNETAAMRRWGLV
ncbi:MAG: hypothetical protein EA398_01675 [Deltaproteobacteria bacterium]|nr:MAG: hypothetical protein EA398_01675 [Deltaproteobacteria bacterium]